MYIKNKKFIIKTFVCCLLLFVNLGCRSNPGEKIKLVLDDYDQNIKDFDSSMRQMHRNNPNVSLQQSLNAIKGLCNKLNKIDASETPPDFRTAFTKLISLDCSNKDSPADLVAHENDPKTKAYNSAERELEEVSAKYGYIYKHSASPK